jgi:signal transduction histidine kinase/DNA-binding NarL/FixJ family response regulator
VVPRSGRACFNRILLNVRTLLVLAQHPELAESIRSALDASGHRVVHRTSWEEAEPLLTHGLAQACLIDSDLTGVQTIWLIEKVRRALPRLPILVCSSTAPWELEEEAYLKGVQHVLYKPIRGRLFNAVLAQVFGETPAPVPPPAPAAAAFDTARITSEAAAARAASASTLEVLRDYSCILTHSLNAEGLLKQFLLFLRETLGVNRAAIFLRQPEAAFGGALASPDSRRLRSACAIGLASGLLEHFELSFDTGIGGQVFRLGRIVRRNSEETRTDIETQKEFELLGAQVAVPILDRETVVGLAVFDGRVTGEPLVNAELELIFHLLEHVGLGIRNIWLHDQLAANNEMMADVLRELSSACIVVSRDLTIIHANKAARKLFGHTGPKAGDLEFTDLPQLVGAKIYQVLKTGSAVESFKYHPENAVRPASYNITVTPFQRQGTALPNAALLVVDDLTQTEQLQKLEMEANSLRLIRTMADRLAHEVGNALVPLSTHQQLLVDRYKDPEFRASLDVALADGVKRISRLINQMRFLARDSIISAEAFPLAPLIEEAYQEAQKYQPVKSARLKCEDGGQPIIVSGDRAALKHALAEILLNALQSNPADPQIGVHLQAPGEAGKGGGLAEAGLKIEIQDNGTGFTSELAQKIPSPFYTTRNVGLGLGLTVTRKIIETHNGKLEIIPSKSGHAGVVRISLPAAAGKTAGVN